MTMLSRWTLAVVTVLLIGGAAFWYLGSGPPIGSGAPPGAPQTAINLDIKIQGAFTYVHSASKQTVDVVFLNDVHAGTCSVMKPDVNLRVLDGALSSPTKPNKNFPLDGVVVTLGSTANGLTQTGPGPVAAGDKPTNVDDPTMWADMKYVPNLFKSAGYALDTSWSTRPAVNGWLELASGTLKAWMPTEPTIKQTLWNFRKPSGVTTVPAQAITNTVWYSASIPGSSLTVTLTPHAGTPSTIVVTPHNGHVLLAFSAAHSESVAQLNPGEAIGDLCATYQLLTTPPDDTGQLLPSYPGTLSTAILPTNGMSTGRPRPGPFCPGDYAEAP